MFVKKMHYNTGSICPAQNVASNACINEYVVIKDRHNAPVAHPVSGP